MSRWNGVARFARALGAAGEPDGVGGLADILAAEASSTGSGQEGEAAWVSAIEVTRADGIVYRLVAGPEGSWITEARAVSRARTRQPGQAGEEQAAVSHYHMTVLPQAQALRRFARAVLPGSWEELQARSQIPLAKALAAPADDPEGNVTVRTPNGPVVLPGVTVRMVLAGEFEPHVLAREIAAIDQRVPATLLARLLAEHHLRRSVSGARTSISNAADRRGPSRSQSG